MIVRLLLGPVQPAQRAMHAQAEGLGEGVAQLALAGLEGSVVEGKLHIILRGGGRPSMALARGPSRPGDEASIHAVRLTG
jgi:hypothetical protein